MRILVTPTSFQPDSPSEALKKLRAFCPDLRFNPHGRPLRGEELAALLADCDGYIAGLDFVTADALAGANRLRVISRYGAGVDRVDIEAARARGIAVFNTPGANAQAVADLALGLMLSVARDIPALHAATRSDHWPRSTGVELYGKTLGILGLGAIGKNVARRAQGFSMRVMAYDPYIDREYASAHGIEQASLPQILHEADVISLHLPLTEQTRHVIGADEIAAMGKRAILINTARGGLIDERAAAEGLKSGRLYGIGLDVYEQEPPGDSPLFAMDRVVLTPHTASHTREATENMADAAVHNLIRALRGENLDRAL